MINNTQTNLREQMNLVRRGLGSSLSHQDPPLRLAIKYHLHQPYTFPSDETNMDYFPYVRMHSLRAYHDMPLWAEKFGVKVNFNITGCLIAALEFMMNGGTDQHLEITKIRAEKLTMEQKQYILENFFSLNYDHTIKRIPSFLKFQEIFYGLLNNRPFYKINPEEKEQIINKFSPQEYRDIQALGNLALFGIESREQITEIGELLKKGKNYTEDDKKKIIELQFKVMGEVLEKLKKMQDDGEIEITTSPFFHPIIPLICNATNNGEKSTLKGKWVESFAHPDDILAQLHMAYLQYNKTFGRYPKGLWPSEGAVCDQMFPLIERSMPGVKYILTDQAVLKSSSIGDDWKRSCAPWRFRDSNIFVIGRNTGFSNIISFNDEHLSPEDMKNKIIHALFEMRNNYLRQLEEQQKLPPSPLVLIAMDGENMQEYYDQDARPYFYSLYQALRENQEKGIINSVLLSDFAKDDPWAMSRTFNGIHPGSWINNDLVRWAGEPYHPAAWKLLADMANEMDLKYKGILSSGGDRLAEAQKEIYEAITNGYFFKELYNSKMSNLAKALAYRFAAETSCFMWWYALFGGDKGGFDSLFRGHILSAYFYMGSPIPENLLHNLYRNSPDPRLEWANNGSAKVVDFPNKEE